MNSKEFQIATKGKKIIKQYFNKSKCHILVFDDKSKYEISNDEDDGIVYYRLDKPQILSNGVREGVMSLKEFNDQFYEKMIEKYSNENKKYWKIN